MQEGLSKGLFGLSRKEVDNYISDLKADYENEMKKLVTELQAMKEENIKLNNRLNEFLTEKKEIEDAKQSISDVLFKAEQQAKQVIEEAKQKAIEERQEIDQLLEAEKEKLMDAKIDLEALKEKAKELIIKFADDIGSL
jgi:cell division initiation protein